MSPLRLSTPQTPILYTWSSCLCDNHLPLQFEASLIKGESFTETNGYKGQYLELNLMLCPFKKIIIGSLLGHRTSPVIGS